MVKERHADAAKRYGQQKKDGITKLQINEWMDVERILRPSDPLLQPAKNYSQLKQEAEARISRGSELELISIDPNDSERDLYELIESIENGKQIQEIYRLRKKLAKDDGGLSLGEAAKVKHCFAQGRELYRSGSQGSLLVKPLNYFYALTAYSYGIILLNNPLRYRKDMLPGSHGINYLPNTAFVQFGGDMPRGTFSDLVTSFPARLIKGREFELIGECLSSVESFYRNRCEASLGTLLSMVPEMGDFFRITTGRNGRAYPLSVIPARNITRPSPTFIIGDGDRRPNKEKVFDEFPNSSIEEIKGQIHVSVEADDLRLIDATIYTDISGRLWYVENPFGKIMLPEIALHFLILAVFSNVMRYRPDEWGGLVDNDVSANVSLAARHYFNVIERKFNCIILRDASRFYPLSSV